jgi:hypothetical protein
MEMGLEKEVVLVTLYGRDQWIEAEDRFYLIDFYSYASVFGQGRGYGNGYGVGDGLGYGEGCSNGSQGYSDYLRDGNGSGNENGRDGFCG